MTQPTNLHTPPSGSRLISRVIGRVKRDARRYARRLHGSTKTVDKALAEGCKVTEIYPAQSFAMQRPANFDDGQWEVFHKIANPHLPPAFVAEVQNGFVYGHDSWVFTETGRGITGMWRPHGVISDKQRIADLGKITLQTLGKARRLNGRTLLLNQVEAGNFYHFVNEVIPRLKLYSELGALSEIDHFIVHDRIAGFMKAWFDAAGIDTDKLVTMNGDGFACETLFYSNNIAPQSMVPKWALDYSGSVFATQTDTRLPKRLFITRQDAAKRRLLNRDAIEAVVVAKGFTPTTMDGRTPEQQANLFYNADCIVGVHGAALANLMFCRPGTGVIELIPNNHLEPCFWTSGLQLQLDHHLITGTEKPLAVAKWRRDVNADLTIDPGELARMLDQLLPD